MNDNQPSDFDHTLQRRSVLRRRLSTTAGLAAAMLALPASAQTLTPLYGFVSASQRYHDVPITFDATGTFLYGEGYRDGTHGAGTIFKLAPPAGGGTPWVRRDLVNFASVNRDPVGGLTLDPVSGSLFGVSQTAGTTLANDGNGNGAVFRLDPSGTKLTLKILTRFNGNNGSDPISPPTLDSSGNLIGGTFAGGIGYNANATGPGGNTGSLSGGGVIYNLAPPVSGTAWTKTVLRRFGAGGAPANPSGPLLKTASGDLYGVTQYGGPYNAGAVFSMHKTGSGWTTKIIYRFLARGPGIGPHGQDGVNPQGPLIADQAGNLYGTTLAGGIHLPNNTGGTVFKLSPTPSGGWTETILYYFGNSKNDGYSYSPTGGLVLLNGVLYGATTLGGYTNGGTLFSLTPPAAGQTAWTERVLYTFNGGTDGARPLGHLIADSSGNLYGATSNGGNQICLCGSVFKFSP